MKVLELFAGSRSIGKVCDEIGHTCFSVDIKPFDGINLVKDIEDLQINDVPFVPDMIIAGTPCTTYSLCAISHHRYEDYSPKTDFAFKCDRMNVHILKLIDIWLRYNPELVWYIENPRATLRKMWFMQGLPRQTVWYCQYNDHYNRAKPTDFWSNNFRSLFNPHGWQPRPECRNYKYDKEGNILNKHCTHESARAGSKAGTQGLKNNYERSTYPRELCVEIIEATERKLGIS